MAMLTAGSVLASARGRVTGAWWLAGLLIGLALAWAQVPVPPLAARVTDLSGVLSPAERQALEARLARFEADKGSQLAILILPTTRPESIEQYGIRVAEAWRLGRKGVDDGVLLLVATEDRAVRIEVGYGLEGAIPDALAKRIVEERIIPRLRAGDYAGGLEAGITALIGAISGEPLPPPTPGRSDSAPTVMGSVLPMAMLFAFVLGGFLRLFIGRLPAAAVTGALGFLGAWWLSASLAVAVFVLLLTLIFTLGFGQRAWRGHAGGRGWPGGGGFGGGSGGGFGSGFGGGGGGFGGGGASGRW
ncbi:MAG: TPM domain-containing protein [Thiobacillaceae bacterium]|nr:TPM domain-containing protein [Thiobacillaceae bacterium]